MATAFAVAFVVYSCKGKLGEAESINIEETPMQVVDDMFIVHTKNGKIQMRAQAPLMEKYERDSLSYELFPDGFFVYSYNEEADVKINKGFSVVPREAYISENGYVGMSPYGCQGDSEAYWFLESNEDVKEVVVFGNGWTYNKNIPEEDCE